MADRQVDVPNSDDLPLFYQAWWLDIVCGGSSAWTGITYKDGDGRIWGYWPLTSVKKWGQRLYLPPDLTPFNGPLIFYPDNLAKQERRLSHEHKVINALIKQVPTATAYRFRCVPTMRNWLPFYNASYRQTTQYTYQIKGIKDLTTVQSNYKSSVRNDIQYAEEHYHLEACTQADQLLPLIDATHHRKHKKTPVIAQKIVDTTLAKGYGAAWVVKDRKSGDHVAGGHIVWDQNKAYLLLLGVDKSQKPRGAVQLLVHHLISVAATKVDVFDFEGSMIPEVEPVYRAFGGELTPYSIISKASRWYDWLFMTVRRKAW